MKGRKGCLILATPESSITKKELWAFIDSRFLLLSSHEFIKNASCFLPISLLKNWRKLSNHHSNCHYCKQLHKIYYNSLILNWKFILRLIQAKITTIIIELTHSKTTLENTVEIEPQPVALDVKNLSQYSSHSK